MCPHYGSNSFCRLGNGNYKSFDHVYDYCETSSNWKSCGRYLDEEYISDIERGRIPSNLSSNSGCCYVATCVYGSYDCPEVWTLRRFRDNSLNSSWFGKRFIQIYYAIGPKIVKLLGNKKWFNLIGKSVLDRFVTKLWNNGVDNSPYYDH